jgi:hypothetical protein
VRKWSRKQEIAINLRRDIEKTEDKPDLLVCDDGILI